MNLIKNKIALVFGMLLMSGATFAGAGGDKLELQPTLMMLLLAVIVLIVFVVLGIGVKIINNMADMQKDIAYKAKGLNIPKRKAKKSMFHSWTKAVDIEKETDIDLGHDYDGIRELDNVLPPWWVGLFYITIVFAVFYMVYYTEENDQYYEYKQEMLAAQMQQEAYFSKVGEPVNEKTATYLSDEASLADGKEIYAANCMPCHGNNGEGQQTYPNLTDEFWMHGGGVKNIFKTVKLGIPGTGMIAWKNVLNATKINKVSSYIWSLQGSNPANAKEAQGDKWEDKE